MAFLLMQIIEEVGGEKQYRNIPGQGSFYLKRYNSFFGNRPVIAVGEKGQESELHTAEREQTEKATALHERETKIKTISRRKPSNRGTVVTCI